MKQEFINFVNALIAAAPDVAESMMTENIKQYMEALTGTSKDKPELTDNGKLVLKYMKDNCESNTMWKAKDIADGLFISSRTVSGAMRKLVTDGFAEKVGQDPVIYTLTEKGKNYNIEN
jgi:DNA-binding MarR family transcriptional regulator